ncbi:hypothetical protein J0A71_06g14120 [Encephalitozoon cuniculi]|nr:hypothetical protein ECU04_1520 [Encephalitozoon cuniculi]UYI27539.1 hypothetical protein J0A71_06g14120 [Encephalitozoon cuniculi]
MEGRMELASGVDYIIRGSRRDIERLLCLPKPTITLTPYKSRCSDLGWREDGQDAVTTPKGLAENLGEMRSSHVLVEDCELMEYFGYLGDLMYLKSRGVSFVLLNVQRIPKFVEDPVFLSSNRCFIRAIGDERYAVIFALCRIYRSIRVICKDVERVRMFSEIFKLSLDAVSHGSGMEGGGVVVVMDRFVDVECEKLFYIGRECKGMKTVVLDMSKIGKFLYRIRDVCNMLSPAVVRGRKEFNINRFHDIDK